MDNSKKEKISSAKLTDRIYANEKLQHEIYCESQDVSGFNENKKDKYSNTEKKKNRFFANYNMFF